MGYSYRGGTYTSGSWRRLLPPRNCVCVFFTLPVLRPRLSGNKNPATDARLISGLGRLVCGASSIMVRACCTALCSAVPVLNVSPPNSSAPSLLACLMLLSCTWYCFRPLSPFKYQGGRTVISRIPAGIQHTQCPC